MAVEQGIDAQRIRELDKAYVLHSWSVQNQLQSLPVAGAEGRYFWDYDGNRYLDFASQLVNVSIGHQHPKLVAAIKEQADKLCTIGPPMATEPRAGAGAGKRPPPPPGPPGAPRAGRAPPPAPRAAAPPSPGSPASCAC